MKLEWLDAKLRIVGAAYRFENNLAQLGVQFRFFIVFRMAAPMDVAPVDARPWTVYIGTPARMRKCVAHV